MLEFPKLMTLRCQNILKDSDVGAMGSAILKWIHKKKKNAMYSGDLVH